MKRAKEIAKRRKAEEAELDKSLDKALQNIPQSRLEEDISIEEQWSFVHDDLDCQECKTLEGSFALEYFEGTVNGRDAQKYSCTNEECGYEEIIYMDELIVNEDGSVTK